MELHQACQFLQVLGLLEVARYLVDEGVAVLDQAPVGRLFVALDDGLVGG